MATTEPSSPQKRVAVSLVASIHLTRRLWEDIATDEPTRAVIFFARHVLQDLELGDPVACDRSIAKMDAALALVNGQDGDQ